MPSDKRAPRRNSRILGQIMVKPCERLIRSVPRAIERSVPIAQEIGDDRNLKCAASPQPDRLILSIPGTDVDDLPSQARVRRRLPGETEPLGPCSRYHRCRLSGVGSEKLPGARQPDGEPVLAHLGSRRKVAAILRQEHVSVTDADRNGCNGHEHGFGCSVHRSSPPDGTESTPPVPLFHLRGSAVPRTPLSAECLRRASTGPREGPLRLSPV